MIPCPYCGPSCEKPWHDDLRVCNSCNEVYHPMAFHFCKPKRDDGDDPECDDDRGGSQE